MYYSDYFPMQKVLNFPKLFFHTISRTDYQCVTKGICHTCDRIHGFCDKNCDKLFSEKLRITDNTSIFRVKGEKMALSRSSEICRDSEIFQQPKKGLFTLE